MSAAARPTILILLGEDWLERRKLTHRAYRNDRNRRKKDLKPFFGECKPTDVNAALLREFVERKLAEGLSSTTVGHLVRQLSSFFADVVEKGYAAANPVAVLPRSTRRLYRNAKDPRTTPFLEKLEDLRRVFLALPKAYGVAFAVGALAGLRTGEVLEASAWCLPRATPPEEAAQAPHPPSPGRTPFGSTWRRPWRSASCRA